MTTLLQIELSLFKITLLALWAQSYGTSIVDIFLLGLVIWRRKLFGVMVFTLLSFFDLIILTIECLTQEILRRTNFKGALTPKIIYWWLLLHWKLFVLSFGHQFFVHLLIPLLIHRRWLQIGLLNLRSLLILILKPVATATLIRPTRWALILQNSNNVLLVLVTVLHLFIFWTLLEIKFLPLRLTTLIRLLLFDWNNYIIGVNMVI